MTLSEPASTSKSIHPTWFHRVFKIRKHELGPALWSFAYFFCLLSAYCVLRPVREALGIARGVKQLPWLFTGTFVVMLAAMPAYWFLVKRFRRRLFIPVIYRFFTLNLLVFAGLLWFWPQHEIYTGRAFFIWLSVFNLMVVSVFWSFMVDVFSNEQGRRLFGFIAGGGSLGALAGSLFTHQVVKHIGLIGLMLVSALLLEAAVQCVREVGKQTTLDGDPVHGSFDRKPVGGGLFEGLRLMVRSPYLLGICGYMFLATYVATVLYFAQGSIVHDAIPDTHSRVQLFARINLFTQALTLLLQLFVASRLIQALGVGLTLILLPLTYLVGFTWLGFVPTLTLVVVFQVLRRGVAYGVAKPTKETLFTLVSDEEKYKSKSFIDTVIFRGGDAAAGWLFNGLKGLGLGLGAIAFLTLPVCAAWVHLGLYLGKKQRQIRGARKA